MLRSLVFAFVLLSPAALHAQENAASQFGERGHIALSAPSDIGFAPLASYSLAPGIDVFVGRHVSIGGELRASYDVRSDIDRDTKTKALALGPRFGFVVPLSPSLTLDPRVTIGFRSAWATFEGTSNGPGPSDAPTKNVLGGYVSLFVPLLFHPSPHFFFGGGLGVTQLFGGAWRLADVETTSTQVAAELTAGMTWGPRS